MSQVLIVDRNGTPRDWANLETAAIYYATNKMIWEIGSTIKTFLGGIDRNGERSKLDISSIIGVRGPILGHTFYARETVHADRSTLYSRDQRICAYCGTQYEDRILTIDHVIPRSRGGKNTWVNCVTACKPCNNRKDDRTPEEARMQLLYVPYAPTIQEKILLKGRKVLADQMEYLMASIPKTSRVWRNIQ
jgi:hypothetical protein